LGFQRQGASVLSLVGPRGANATATEAIASVWGREEGITVEAKDVGDVGNLPMIYPDLTQRDPEIVRSFIQSFSNEESSVLVTAANTSLVDIVSSVDRSDSLRIFELPSKLPDGFGETNNLRRELKANSGWAGDAYIRRLVQPETISFIKEGLPRWTDDIWAATGLGDECRHWVQLLAGVVAASTIVKGIGLLDFSPSRIATWAMDEMKAKTVATPTIPKDPIAILSLFLTEHMRDSLVVKQGWQDTKHKCKILIRHHENLFIRYEMEEGQVFVKEAPFHQWLNSKGIKKNDLLPLLRAAGVLMRERIQKTLGAGTEYSGRQVVTYVFNCIHPDTAGKLTPFSLQS